ncbi:unnamed protein product, partial [Ixodes persulcatus]
TPKLYGLTKVHKPECPLRPIVSFIGSPTYDLSKYLVELLTPLTGNNNFGVKNSQEFVRLIRAQTLLPHESMISCDVVSLFTNVPNDLAVDVARQRLLDDRTLSTRTSLHVDDIILLLRFCLKQCFFAFRGEVYHQVNGCPMGSPVSVTAANLVMEYIEEKVFGEIVFPVKFYRRYVDDTFVILDKNFVDDFHQCLNSVHPAIKFTYEPEQTNMLSFLVVCVIRTDEPNNGMETKVYRKPCDSGNFLDFLSHHPVQHKKSVVRTFVHRSNTVPSNATYCANELARVQESLQKRNYPGRFVDEVISQTKRKTHSNPADKERNVLCISYVKGVSESLSRALKPVGIRTVYKPYRTIASIVSKPRDPTPADTEKGIVYKIPYQDCGSSYIGETGRKKITRMKEHQRDVKYSTNATRLKT